MLQMNWDPNIIFRNEYHQFRKRLLLGRPMYVRPNKAVLYFLPGELGDELSARIFQMKYLETRIKLAEYDRWMNLLTGSTTDSLISFYRDMVKKYVPNYYHYGLLIYLHDKENEKTKI